LCSYLKTDKNFILEALYKDREKKLIVSQNKSIIILEIFYQEGEIFLDQDDKPKYYLNENNQFVIENYNKIAPFSSFLPAISGLYGKPMWVFYANRGQCVVSAGINNKNYSIMEFLPANKAYRQVSLNGFRTFLKIRNGRKTSYYEPFQNNPYFNKIYKISHNIMYITSYDLKLEEVNETLGLRIEIMYCTLPNETISSLIRSVRITNISKGPLEIELIDGLPIIIPYYLTDYNLKNESNLRQAWMRVENYKTIPFYKIKVLPYDTPEIIHVEGGNFFLNFSFDKNNETIFSKFIIEPRVIFGNFTDFLYPENFIMENFKIPKDQVNEGTTPCGFGFKKIKLGRDDSKTIYTLLGNSDKYEKLNRFVNNTLGKKYLLDKISENQKIIENLKNPIFCLSSEKKFDLYCGQTFMDNFIRGGYPVELGNSKHIFYVYSRKHGDLEREYNFFEVDSTNFSQGNSHFRDVCQNRRNDVFFFPYTDYENIKIFFNLIQLDGYNPLALKGSVFRITDTGKLEKIIGKYIKKAPVEQLKKFFNSEFTPGSFLSFIDSYEIDIVEGTVDELLNKILSISSKEDMAEFQEGYWVDHWTYNTDLIEQYISVYPDKIIDLLFKRIEFTYFDSAVFVKQRSRKYLLTKNGVRQLKSLEKIPEKEEIIKKRIKNPNKTHTNMGKGDVYKCSLLSKIICIILNKIASLDPEGTGIEMEADKPGWCDALNGLPGILGSSINESAEFKRLSLLLLNIFNLYRINKNTKIKVPEEISLFFREIKSLLDKKIDEYSYWNLSHSVKENFRNNTKLGISGKEEEIDIGTLTTFLNTAVAKINRGLEKAYNKKSGVYYTYFINEVTDYELLRDKSNNLLKNEDGYPYVKPLKFKQRPIPYFLEGPVHIMRIEKDIKKASKLYNSIKNTGLYDNKLKMYLVNDYIMNETCEIGRQNIFPRGWLENESVFLHMEYKYLLELLRCGLHDEFFQDFKIALVPFLNPSAYGRSILENSTFIASSSHQDKKIHGKGYVSRLSGSATELLSMWILMTAGKNPFFLDRKGKLCLEFKPILPGWLFTKKNESIFFYKDMREEKIILPANSFAFNFLGRVLTIYHNRRRRNTFGKEKASVNRIILYESGSEVADIQGSIISMPYSSDIRNGIIDRIDVFME
jgi:hypothetical protein